MMRGIGSKSLRRGAIVGMKQGVHTIGSIGSKASQLGQAVSPIVGMVAPELLPELEAGIAVGKAVGQVAKMV